jgi:hypothetical protein
MYKQTVWGFCHENKRILQVQSKVQRMLSSYLRCVDVGSRSSYVTLVVPDLFQI